MVGRIHPRMLGARLKLLALQEVPAVRQGVREGHCHEYGRMSTHGLRSLYDQPSAPSVTHSSKSAIGVINMRFKGSSMLTGWRAPMID